MVLDTKSGDTRLEQRLKQVEETGVDLVMHVYSVKTRRSVAILGAALVAGLLIATETGASAAPSVAAGPTFVLTGAAVGGVKTIQTGQTLTFVFKETNKGSASAPEDLVLQSVTNASVTGGPLCVLPNGFAINSDGFSCEPGQVSPGQSASSVITTNVTGGSGQSVSARLCLDNESTGLVGPCKKVTVKIA